MSRPVLWMLLALVAAPPIAYLVYRLAAGLGFLEPPIDKQHEQRRTIIVALYTFLLFLPVLIYGFEKGWPRAWIIFGIVNGLALLFFAASGIWAARRLWKLRHPDFPEVEAAEPNGTPRTPIEFNRTRGDTPALPGHPERSEGVVGRGVRSANGGQES